MQNRLRSAGIPTVLVLVPLFAAGIKVATPSPSSSAQQIQRADPGGIRLKNIGAEAVRVEIGAAPDGDCAGKARVTTTGTVAAGRSWEIRSSQPICIRQEKVDGAGQRRMQAWEKKTAAAGQVQEVIL